MRLLNLTFAGAALLGVSCLPPDQQLGAENATSDNVGEQVSAATPEGTHCHSGTFECADGATVFACGTWYFDMNDSGTVTGAGEITNGLPTAPLQIALSGAIDEGVDGYDIVLLSAEGGMGELNLSYPGPTLELAGSWSFTNAPEPAGIEVSGGAAGTSCSALP